jgi:Uri superfamily endonuclease
MIPATRTEPGTYALVLAATKKMVVTIGQLGEVRLRPGFYVYVGSAFGSGGVRARLNHHLRPAARPYWHIDYLRMHALVQEVWYCYGRVSWEHEWAQHLETVPGASIPLPKFGASDCRCRSHLFFFRSRPLGDVLPRKVEVAAVCPKGSSC